MLLTDDKDAAEKVRKWSTQSRENAPWYQHEEFEYCFVILSDETKIRKRFIERDI